MPDKTNKISSMLLPLIVVIAAFMWGGFKWGMIASLVLMVFAIFKFLPAIYVYLAMFNYKKDNDKTLYALGKKEEVTKEARIALGFPFNHLAGAPSEEVASFLENVERELEETK